MEEHEETVHQSDGMRLQRAFAQHESSTPPPCGRLHNFLIPRFQFPSCLTQTLVFQNEEKLA